jgi:hypothetical protein
MPAAHLVACLAAAIVVAVGAVVLLYGEDGNPRYPGPIVFAFDVNTRRVETNEVNIVSTHAAVEEVAGAVYYLDDGKLAFGVALFSGNVIDAGSIGSCVLVQLPEAVDALPLKQPRPGNVPRRPCEVVPLLPADEVAAATRNGTLNSLYPYAP